MAAIKSFTDIEQSKKLAEILPLESADMAYYFMKDSGHLVNLSPFVLDGTEVRENGMFTYLNCWSLAALLDIIPQELFDGEYIINITEGRDNKWILTYDRHENRNHSYYGLSIGADNLINACYELILKLNELKML